MNSSLDPIAEGSEMGSEYGGGADLELDLELDTVEGDLFSHYDNDPMQQSAMRQATEEVPQTRAERRRSRRERILGRRGAFRWLPIKFHNDLVHGSWWFVAGSVGATLIPIVPLLDLYYTFWDTGSDKSVPLLEDAATFGLLIASGLFFTLGSLAFLRATDEPPLKPLFSHISIHMATDELLASWLFLFATIPFIPFMAVYVYYNSDVLLYWGCLVASAVFVLSTYFFVLACYPSNREERRHQIVPMLVNCLCKSDCCGLNKHLCNDWLAGMWVFFWGTFVLLAGNIFMLAYTMQNGGQNHLEIFDWATSSIDALLFLIGSAYFCAGSYPQGVPHHFVVTHGTPPSLNKDDFRDKGLSTSPTPYMQPHGGRDHDDILDIDVGEVDDMERISLLTPPPPDRQQIAHSKKDRAV